MSSRPCTWWPYADGELAEEPGLLEAVYAAFAAAKDHTAQRYLSGAAKQHADLMTPWFGPLFARNRRLLGDDWWPYGVERNRTAVDTFLRYHHEQGLSPDLLTTNDVFVPALLAT